MMRRALSARRRTSTSKSCKFPVRSSQAPCHPEPILCGWAHGLTVKSFLCAAVTIAPDKSTIRFAHSPLHNRVRFDLHQHLRRNQFTHLDHARRGPYILEKFPMRLPYFFPLGNVSHKHARSYHVLQTRSRPTQCRLNVKKNLYYLRVRVANTDNLPVRSRRGCSCNADMVAHAHRPRVTHNRLPWPRARNILSWHLEPLSSRISCGFS